MCPGSARVVVGLGGSRDRLTGNAVIVNLDVGFRVSKPDQGFEIGHIGAALSDGIAQKHDAFIWADGKFLPVSLCQKLPVLIGWGKGCKTN